MLNSGKMLWRKIKQGKYIETVLEIALSHRVVEKSFNEMVNLNADLKDGKRASHMASGHQAEEKCKMSELRVCKKLI